MSGVIPSAAPPVPTSTVGALEIGTLTGIYLFGVVTGQVYTYFQRCSQDPWGIKLLVCVVWGLDFGHTVAICHCIYTLTITQYGRPDLIDFLPRSLAVSIAISGLIGPLEQGWFAYRLYKFSETRFLPMTCVALSVIRFAGSIGLSTISFLGLPKTQFEARTGWLITTILVIGVTVDFVLTVSLCYYMRSWRHRGLERQVTHF
ncbi:hypothetical protein C8R43DRAFT_897598 [Mycena crocata]|nr:hypothetical protein C8R43DRAFT_897598 [Mycena crocata]